MHISSTRRKTFCEQADEKESTISGVKNAIPCRQDGTNEVDEEYFDFICYFASYSDATIFVIGIVKDAIKSQPSLTTSI